MGVMACDRVDCEHVMCDRLILDGTKYICPSCLEELREYRASWPDAMTAAEIRERIEDFMDKHPPGTFLVKEGVDVEAVFQHLTGGGRR